MGFLENYRIFRDLEGFLEVLVDIFKVFLFIYHQKSLKLGNVSSQAIVKALFAIIDAPSQYRSVVLPIIQHSLLSVSSKWWVLIKAIEFSPQVTQLFLII